jgi:ribonuclease J
MNCLALEQADGILLVDCGTSFPHDDLGIDVIHPDFRWLEANAQRVHGLFLTHGHEDHVGGVPYLLDALDIPIWGPPHALAVVKRRLSEHGYSPEDVVLHEAHPRRRYQVGSFEVEPIRVAHSIIEASALAVRTAAGLVLHTGDFNFDPAPPDGEPTDEARLLALGDEGIELLMSDSTNVDVPERPGSEAEVKHTLSRLVSTATGRVFIALFASNLQRLRSLGEVALATGKKICLLGRSLSNQVEIGHDIGRLRWPSHLRIAPEQLREWPRDRVLVLAGGSQAEPNSAMLRLAKGLHNFDSILAGDTVILSSRVIPGNERAVAEMTCDLVRSRAQVITRHEEPGVHTSGHAGRSEQTRMLELARPRAFLPLHGTLRHLQRHAALARDLGIDECLVVENGQSVLLEDGRLRASDVVPHGRVNVALGGEPLAIETRARRADLGRNGIVFVSLAVSSKRQLVSGPRVVSLGVPLVDQDESAVRSVALEVARAFEQTPSLSPQSAALAEELRRAARRALYDLVGFRPLVEVSVLEIDRS